MCGLLTLEYGVKFIGANDIGCLVVNILLAILASSVDKFKYFFVIPTIERNHGWIVAVEILLVELPRVIAYLYFLKSNYR